MNFYKYIFYIYKFIENMDRFQQQPEDLFFLDFSSIDSFL